MDQSQQNTLRQNIINVVPVELPSQIFEILVLKADALANEVIKAINDNQAGTTGA